MSIYYVYILCLYILSFCASLLLSKALTYMIKPEELYILTFEKAEGRGLFHRLKTYPTIMRIPHNQQLGHTWLIIIPYGWHHAQVG